MFKVLIRSVQLHLLPIFFSTDNDRNSVRDAYFGVSQQVLDNILNELEKETPLTSLFIDSVENHHEISHKESVIDISDVEMIEVEQSGDQNSPRKLVTEKQSTITVPINRPQCTKVFLPGVIFISNYELKFVDQQRYRLNDEAWLPNGAGGECKPSPSWFLETRSKWLRAVYSEKKYGLICITCAKAAKDYSRIMKNQGSFISHPYWKLLHQGLEGKIDF